MPKKPKVLLMDANVLIDYQKSDFSVLGLVNKHVGEVHVLTTIIEEVDGLEIVDCERLGLRAIEPDLNQLTRAAVYPENSIRCVFTIAVSIRELRLPAIFDFVLSG